MRLDFRPVGAASRQRSQPNIFGDSHIIFPRVNAAHARQPAWNDHLDRLRTVGVELIYGEHVWPLAKPRTAGPRELPWAAILSALKPFV
jgi:hypothetical protein